MEILDSDKKSQEELYVFIQDLEFVQCLANPSYLEYLALNDFFKEKEFINYLAYLQYFKKIEYQKFLTYSRCLIFLDLLQYDFFRKELEKPNFIQFLRDKIYANWFEPEPTEMPPFDNNIEMNIASSNEQNGNLTSLEKDINQMDIGNN